MVDLLLTLFLVSLPSQVVAEAADGLVLEIRAPSAEVAEGDIFDLTVVLRNDGRAPRWVVRPGDGSEKGWREPHVWFTADRLSPEGVWEALPRQETGRCGFYDPDWEKDALALAPGERLEMKDWLLDPHYVYRFAPGRYRVRAHYAYQGGAVKGHLPSPPARRVMRDVPPFEVVSAPFEVTVTRR